MDFDTIAVSSTVISLNADKRMARKAFLSLETAQIRFRHDGGDPTATVGHLMNVGDILNLEGLSLQKFRAIRTGSTNGLLTVTFEGT